MAGKYNLFLVLWFVVACLANDPVTNSRAEPEDSVTSTTETVTTPTTVDVTSTPVEGPTTTTGAVTSTPVVGPTPTTVDVTSTPVEGPTTTTGAVTLTPVTVPTTTTGAVTSTPVVGPTTITGAVTSTPVTVPTTTTGAVTSTPVVGPTTTTGAVTSTPVTVTTTTAGAVNPTTGTETAPTATAPGSTSVAPTTAPDPCQPNPCGRGSTCAVRFNQTFVCLCLPGDHYNDGSKVCVKAKVFPGQLSLPKLTYNEKMENKQSPEFKEAAQNITTTLTPLYNITDGFSDVTVLSLQKLAQSRVGSVRMEGVTASIEIIFSESSTITTSEVTSVMEEAAANCSNCLLGGATFNETDNCAAKPCDEVTTTCSSGNGTFVCSCKETYINTTFSDRLCIACPSGQEAVNSSSCKPCKPGFSGLNCLDKVEPVEPVYDWKQTLIIVGSVLGGLLLITLILLIILAVRSSKKSSKKSKHEDIGKPYVSHFTAKAPLANGNGSYANSQIPSYHGSGYEGAGVPKIPRATANNNWERRSNMEMTPSNSRQNLVPMGSNSRLYDDDDDMNSYTRPESNHYASAPARPQSNLYAQSRPQSNPYAQSRPQSNPYAAKQGQNNPYYQ